MNVRCPARQGDAIDSRYHPSAVRRRANKVFPTHWSFLLGAGRAV